MYDTLEKPPKVGGASGIITPEVLAPQKPITLPPAPVPLEPTGIVSRATSLQQALAAQQQKAAEDAKLQMEAVKAEKTGLRSRIDQMFQSTLGRGQEQQQLETQAGIPQQQKELAELIERTTTLNNAFNTQFAAQEGQGRGQVQPFISGQQAAIRRQQAVEIGNLSALAQAKQGNIQMAKDTIRETLDYKYADAKAQVEYELSALDALGEDLTKAEQAQKEARQALLQSQLQEIEVARAEEETVQNYAVEAAKNGADNQTIEAIRKARTVDEAIALASPFIGKLQRDQQSFENNLALRKLGLEEARVNQASQETNIDPTNLVAFAQQYASTGKIPTGIPKGTFGVIAQLAKEAPKPEGSLIDVNTGVKPEISDAKVDGLAALYDIQKKVAELKTLEKERVGGVVGGTLGKIFGSEDQQRYLDLRTEIVDLLSRARTGAALTASEEKFYADQLPGRFSEPLFIFGTDPQKRIENFESKIRGTLDTKLKANGTAIVGFSTVKLGDAEYRVGDVIQNEAGQKGRVNADGSITLIQ